MIRFASFEVLHVAKIVDHFIRIFAEWIGDVVLPQIKLVDHLGKDCFRSDLSDHELVFVRLLQLKCQIPIFNMTGFPVLAWSISSSFLTSSLLC